MGNLVESIVRMTDGIELRNWSTVDLLTEAVRKAPARTAIKEPGNAGRSWTYQEMQFESEKLARALLAVYQPGDRIGVWATNQVNWVFLQIGAAIAGLTLVTMNPANRKDEIEYLLSQSKVRGLFMEKVFRGLDNIAVVEAIRPGLPSLEHIHYFDEFQPFIESNHFDGDFPVVEPEDDALVVYTSGTTGKPKGVVLSHGGAVNNAIFSSARSNLKEGSVWLNTLPMFHVGGSVTMTLACMANTGTQVTLPGFDPELMLRSLGEDRVTITMAVPTMLNAMIEHPAFADTDFSSLEVMVTGGTTIPPETIADINTKLGVDAQVIFGQSEAGGVMCMTMRGDSLARLCESVGQPLPPYSIKIISTDTGEILPVDTIGEICISSECKMKRYLDMPEKTAEAIDAEGWLHTGDLGVITEDGYVKITGRLKDMIIRGGENIYPREIEDKLIEHPDILEVAVFGVPDSKWGEKVVAAVRLQKGSSLDTEGYMAFLENRIARHKIPKDWVDVESFPINPSGKIQKFILVEQFINSVRPAVGQAR